MTQAQDIPLTFAQRFNPRIVVFALVALTLVGFPAYIYLSEIITGGIRDRGSYLEVDLKAMSTFEFDQISGSAQDVPEKWRALDGKKVLLTGEIWQPREANGLMTDFQLVYSIANCCFSGPPKIQHFIQARSVGDRGLEYRANLVRVLGTLRVDVRHEAGRVVQVYALDVESIEPV